MASNKDAATRAMVIAERKLMEKDICEAKIQASMALNFCPELDGLSQLIKVIDIHITYAKTVCGEVDWYGVLGVDPCFDDEIIRKQFLKLARILHPDKNKTSYAEGAFKILSQAWSVLSDKARRETYDQRLGQLKEAMTVPPPMQTRMNGVHVYAGDSSSTRYANSSSHPSKSKSFWTTCRLCKSYFEYKISYFNQLLHCKKCREPFFAVLQPPPLEKGRKSLKSISFLQHPPAHHSHASSVPSNLRGNCLLTAKTGRSCLPGDCSTDAKKFQPGLTKNPSGPASSSFQPSTGSSGDEKIQPGDTSCKPGSSIASFGDQSDFSQCARCTSGPVTSFHSASDGNLHLSRTVSPLSNSKTGSTCSLSSVSTEHVKSPPHASFRPGGAGSAFSYFPAAYNIPSHSEGVLSSAPTMAATSISGSYSTSEDTQLGPVFMPAGAQTSSRPVVSSFQAAACASKDHERIFSSVPVSGTTALSSAQSNDGEKIHASLFQSEYPLPQVLGNVDHDISMTENEVSCISRRELTKKRQADECILLSKGRAEMANKKAAGRRKFRLGNQCTNMNNNLGANRILVHGSSKSNNTGNLSQSRLRSALVQKAKSDLHKKLNEWSILSPSLPMPKIDMKKQDSTDTAEGSDATSAKNTKKVDAVIQNVQGSRLTQTSSVATDCKNIYPNTEDYVTMDVPDPDFHDFDQQRIEELFSEGQIWALYDDDDGMPRFYARITSIESVSPFKIQINRLNSKTNTEIGPTKWITSGYTKTIGNFRIGKHEVSNALSAFSHIVKSKRFPRGVIQIYPGKGETWALYRNWSPSWNERTPEEEIHQYDIVLVLDDYSEQQGVFVAPLVKVAGFRSVFRQQDSVSIQTIQKGELCRFSHQVPSYTLTGEEARNAPKGCMELDPAAMPLELLKFIQVDVVQEDGNSDSTGKSEDEYNRNRLNRLVFTYSRRKKSRHTLHFTYSRRKKSRHTLHSGN